MRQESAVPPATAAPIRVPGWAYPLVTIASLLIGAAAIVRQTRAIQLITDSDLTNFFFKSAQYVLRGDPWHMYAVRGSGLTAGYPNYNPPLSIVLMAPFLALGKAIGFAANFGEQITIVSLPFMIFVPLLGYLVLRALRRLYPAMPETQRLLAFLLIVLSPLTWESIATWYHLEQPMMLCFLVAALIAFQARKEGLAGVLAGLALLSRTTALMPLIALGLLLLLAGEWRALLKLVVAAGGVVAAGLAPFFLFDRTDFLYSFVSWRGTATIGGNSIWDIVAYGGTAGGLRHTLDSLARRLDMPAVVVFVAIVALLAALRLRVSAYSREAWAVMAIAALAVPMLSKTVWPYYYLEPFVLLLIWEFTSMHDRLAGVWRWPVLSFGYLVVAATLSQYIGLQSVGYGDRVAVGLLEFISMLAFALAIWQRMRAAKPVAVAPSMNGAVPLGLTLQPNAAALPAMSSMPAASPGAMPSSAMPSSAMPSSAMPPMVPGQSTGWVPPAVSPGQPPAPSASAWASAAPPLPSAGNAPRTPSDVPAAPSISSGPAPAFGTPPGAAWPDAASWSGNRMPSTPPSREAGPSSPQQLRPAPGTWPADAPRNNASPSRSPSSAADEWPDLNAGWPPQPPTRP